MAAAARSGDLRVDDELHLASLAADEEDPQVTRLRSQLDQRIGEVQLPEMVAGLSTFQLSQSSQIPTTSLCHVCRSNAFRSYARQHQDVAITDSMDLSSAYLDHIDPTGVPGDLCTIAALPLSKAVSILGLKRLRGDPSYRATFKRQHGKDLLTLFTLYFNHADSHQGIELAIAATSIGNRSSSAIEIITGKSPAVVKHWTERLQTLGDISGEHAHHASQDFPRVVFSKSASAEAIFDAICRFVSVGDNRISDISPQAAQEIWDSVKRRQGQDKFRSALLRAYDGRCAITGCNVEPALEAAHIRPYSEVQQHEPDNGLLLRADIHTLFDFHLISIDASKRIAVHPGLIASYPMLVDGFLADPDNTAFTPNPEHLATHYERFRAKLGQQPSTPTKWEDI